MNSPLNFISVIIPTYKREETALECVRHILCGTYQNFEIIVVDQNPQQILKQIIEDEFPNDTRIGYCCLEILGAANARNYGLSRARADYVVFIDDDVFVDGELLSSYNDLLADEDVCASIVAGRIKPVWMASKPSWYPEDKIGYLGLYDIGEQICELPEPHQPVSANIAGRRLDLLALGGFETKLGFNAGRKMALPGEDSLLGMRARAMGYKIYYQPGAIAYHQISPNKLTRRYYIKRFYTEGIAVIYEMMLLGTLGRRKPHAVYHCRQFFRCFARACLPRFRNAESRAKPADQIRMDALGTAAYSLGVIYGLLNPIE